MYTCSGLGCDVKAVVALEGERAESYPVGLSPTGGSKSDLFCNVFTLLATQLHSPTRNQEDILVPSSDRLLG